MKKPKTAHCLEVLTSRLQPHRGCDCAKVEKQGRCTCSCNGPSQCGCTCPPCCRAKLVPIADQPDLFVLVHPHPTTSAPHYLDLSSKIEESHVWSRNVNHARRFASEADAEKAMAKVTVAPVYVLKLAREEL